MVLLPKHAVPQCPSSRCRLLGQTLLNELSPESPGLYVVLVFRKRHLLAPYIIPSDHTTHRHVRDVALEDVLHDPRMKGIANGLVPIPHVEPFHLSVAYVIAHRLLHFPNV